MARLREEPDYQRVATPRLDGEPEALMRGDNLLCVRKRRFVGNHRFQPRTESLSQPGATDGADRRGSALAGRYHLYPAAGRVRLSGRDSGRLLAPGDRLMASPTLDSAGEITASGYTPVEQQKGIKESPGGRRNGRGLCPCDPRIYRFAAD